jgi:hypothetical protein
MTVLRARILPTIKISSSDHLYNTLPYFILVHKTQAGVVLLRDLALTSMCVSGGKQFVKGEGRKSDFYPASQLLVAPILRDLNMR